MVILVQICRVTQAVVTAQLQDYWQKANVTMFSGGRYGGKINGIKVDHWAVPPLNSATKTWPPDYHAWTRCTRMLNINTMEGGVGACFSINQTNK